MNPIFLALIPFVAWALGDFFIQKATRKIGNARILFYLCVFSTIVFLPFIPTGFGSLINFQSILQIENINFLLFTGIFGFIYAMTIFQAFKVAKLSVVEAVIALELPMTVFQV